MHKYWTGPLSFLGFFVFLLFLILAAPAMSRAQGRGYHPAPPPVPPTSLQSTGLYSGQIGGPPQRQDPSEIEAQHKMVTQANKERQASLKKDTDQLYKLATELKTSVDKTSEYTLSLEVIKKAEEIERLAKNVKDKMKASGYQPGVESGGR